MNRRHLAASAALTVILMTTSAEAADRSADGPAESFIADHEARIRPLERAANLAWWNANVTGKDADFQAKEDAQNRLDAALADRGSVRRAEGAERDAKLVDPLLDRTIAVLYLTYLEKQVDPALLRKITAKANAVEKAFNAYRAKVDGRELTDSQVRKVLKTSKDPAERQKVWEASKAVGPLVEADLKALVLLAERGRAGARVRQLSTPCSSP